MSADLDGLVDAYEAAEMLHVAPSTVRSWARKGWIRRLNPGVEGRALYDPAQVLRHATRRLA